MERETSESKHTLRSNGSRDSRIKGMESVVATVSGYHGSERFKLIKLINQTGANYVGAMTKSTTHLVCWRFEGRKYKLAKEFGTFIVSHRWFEDCEKEGRRLPERHYVMQSGHQVGPLSWELPVPGLQESLLSRKNHDNLYDPSNTRNETAELEINEGCLGSSYDLLREDVAVGDENKTYRRHKKNQGLTPSLLNSTSRSKRISSPFTGVLREQDQASCSYSPIICGKNKRSLFDDVEGTSRAEPTRKSRRLMKKNASRDVYESTMFRCEEKCSPLEHHDDQGDILADPSDGSDYVRSGNLVTILDSEPECSTAEICDHANIPAAPNDSNGLSNEDAILLQGTRPNDAVSDGENRVVERDNIKLDNVPSSSGICTLSDGVLPSQERSSPTGFSDAEENSDGQINEFAEFREPTKLPSLDLACVICWTDYSSTRGVLPCGHRFCYSCIQTWADRMASSRMVSTCPLCKATFVSITKVDDAASSDQKIYSQTIPCASSEATDIFTLYDMEISRLGAQFSAAKVCFACRSREPEDLLVRCNLCQNRWVHSYCLDPPLDLDLWTCVNCRDLRRQYQRIR